MVDFAKIKNIKGFNLLSSDDKKYFLVKYLEAFADGFKDLDESDRKSIEEDAIEFYGINKKSPDKIVKSAVKKINDEISKLKDALATDIQTVSGSTKAINDATKDIIDKMREDISKIIESQTGILGSIPEDKTDEIINAIGETSKTLSKELASIVKETNKSIIANSDKATKTISEKVTKLVPEDKSQDIIKAVKSGDDNISDILKKVLMSSASEVARTKASIGEIKKGIDGLASKKLSNWRFEVVRDFDSLITDVKAYRI